MFFPKIISFVYSLEFPAFTKFHRVYVNFIIKTLKKHIPSKIPTNISCIFYILAAASNIFINYKDPLKKMLKNTLTSKKLPKRFSI